MAESFRSMDTSNTSYKHRVMCLTADTSNALNIALTGLVSLAQKLLNKCGLPYVLFKNFQSDRLEGEFGVLRQADGGNYYMGTDQVCNALKLQRIKLFSKIDTLETTWHSGKACCQQPLSEEEMELLNDCFDLASSVNDIDRSSVYYIAGYVCHKENLHPTFDDPQLTQPACPANKFVNQLSRGKLSHPPSYLYDLGLYLSAYYKHVKDKTCVNRIYIATHIDIPNSHSVLRRFVNTFTKAFAKNETENIAKEKKQNVVKRKRLER